METLKIKLWDSEKMHYLCDKEDEIDCCIYVWGEKIKINPSKSEESDEWMEHEFELWEDVTEELGVGKHKWAIRLNWKTVEPLTIIISNPEDDEENNED